MGAAPPGSASLSTSPVEALEAVVRAGPAAAASLVPLVAAFARLAGLGGRRARALATEVVGLVAAACRRAGPVRLRLLRRPRRLRVQLHCERRGAPALRQARRGGARADLSVVRSGRGSLVLTVCGPFRDP